MAKNYTKCSYRNTCLIRESNLANIVRNFVTYRDIFLSTVNYQQLSGDGRCGLSKLAKEVLESYDRAYGVLGSVSNYIDRMLNNYNSIFIGLENSGAGSLDIAVAASILSSMKMIAEIDTNFESSWNSVVLSYEPVFSKYLIAGQTVSSGASFHTSQIDGSSLLDRNDSVLSGAESVLEVEQDFSGFMYGESSRM